MPQNIVETPTRVFDLLDFQLKRFPKPNAFAQKINGSWRTYSTAESIAIIRDLAWGLSLLGVRKGDRIANSSETNRPEWNFIDNAVMSLGAVHVPIYPNNCVEEFAFILEDSETKLIFVSGDRLFRLISNLRPTLHHLERIYTYDPVDEALDWQSIRTAGAAGLVESDNRNTLEKIRADVQPNDLATLIYTSGTTGTPKGVMLSHANLIANCLSCSPLIESGPAEFALSFLPLCHIYERTIINIYINCGTAIYYAETLETIGQNIREMRPEVFSTVPRILEKIYERIVARGSALSGLKRQIFFSALKFAVEFAPERQMDLGDRIRFALFDKLVYSVWRAALGGRVRAIICGSAALRPQLARFFWAAGMPVYEGYGPTEASPVIAVNYPGKMKIGTVGPIVPGGEIKIAPDNEILYRGANVMLGYYKKSDLTAQTIDEEGWLHTGDAGSFDDGFLRITDRKKEIFKTSGGKYIAPQQVENIMQESKFIAQIMVVGENHKFPAALIVPAFQTLSEQLERNGGSAKPNEELAKDPETFRVIEQEIDRLNAQLGHHSQIKKFVLLDREWSVTTGELTPTLKLKRKQIQAKNISKIASLYLEAETGAAIPISPPPATDYERTRLHR